MISLGMSKARFFNRISPTTAKGDLTIRGAAENARLPVGGDNTVLASDSSTGNGRANVFRHRLFDGPLVADGNAYTNSTTPTLIPSAVVDIGAAMNVVENTIKVEVTGSLAVTGTPTMAFALRWGSTLLYAFTATTAAAGGFSAGFLLTTKTAGSSGVIRASGLFCFLASRMGPVTAPTETTVDLTDASADLNFYGTWSAQSNLNICICTNIVATAMNF